MLNTTTIEHIIDVLILFIYNIDRGEFCISGLMEGLPSKCLNYSCRIAKCNHLTTLTSILRRSMVVS